MAEQTVRQLAPSDFAPFPRRLAVMLAHLSAREIGRAVADALASAVCNGRRELLACELPAAFAMIAPEPLHGCTSA